MPALFADSELISGLPNWLSMAGLFVTAVLAPYFKDVWLLVRKQKQAERTQETDEEREARKQGRKEKTDDDKRIERLQDKINERIEANEARCQDELAGMRSEMQTVYRYMAMREALIGRWCGKVAGWMDYAAGEMKAAGREFKPFTDPPPDMPDVPRRPSIDEAT